MFFQLNLGNYIYALAASFQLIGGLLVLQNVMHLENDFISQMRYSALTGISNNGGIIVPLETVINAARKNYHNWFAALYLIFGFSLGFWGSSETSSKGILLCMFLMASVALYLLAFVFAHLLSLILSKLNILKPFEICQEDVPDGTFGFEILDTQDENI